MTLTGLSQHRHYWTTPLVLALLVSWCALLCVPNVQAAPADSLAEQAIATDCHGQSLPPSQDTPHDDRGDADKPCPDCERAFIDASGHKTQLQFALLAHWLNQHPPTFAQAPGAFPLPPPIPPPQARLHLLKSVFLI